MMKRKRTIAADEGGAAIIETAIALPVLVSMIYGIFSMGMLFYANAGMQHALGEAARFATLYVEANKGPPSDSDIIARIEAKKFGIKGGTWATPQIDNSQIANGYKTITLTYTKPMNFLFVQGPSVTLTRSKRVYLAS